MNVNLVVQKVERQKLYFNENESAVLPESNFADLLHPPLEGAGRFAWSEAQCESGWGDSLSTKQVPTLIQAADTLRLPTH